MNIACSKCSGTGNVPFNKGIMVWCRFCHTRVLVVNEKIFQHSSCDRDELDGKLCDGTGHRVPKPTCPICEGTGKALPSSKEPLFFKLYIELGNDTMKTARQVGDALSDVVFKLGKRRTEGKILDVNGNSVGKFGFYK